MKAGARYCRSTFKITESESKNLQTGREYHGQTPEEQFP